MTSADHIAAVTEVRPDLRHDFLARKRIVDQLAGLWYAATPLERFARVWAS